MATVDFFFCRIFQYLFISSSAEVLLCNRLKLIQLVNCSVLFYFFYYVSQLPTLLLCYCIEMQCSISSIY